MFKKQQKLPSHRMPTVDRLQGRFQLYPDSRSQARSDDLARGWQEIKIYSGKNPAAREARTTKDLASRRLLEGFFILALKPFVFQ
jgi:hypothetical protein